MIIQKIWNNTNTLTIQLEGNLDTMTAPEVQEYIFSAMNEETQHLILDFEKVQYISSSGLRIIMILYKKMLNNGDFQIINVNSFIMDIFRMTGFADLLQIVPKEQPDESDEASQGKEVQ